MDSLNISSKTMDSVSQKESKDSKADFEFASFPFYHVFCFRVHREFYPYLVNMLGLSESGNVGRNQRRILSGLSLFLAYIGFNHLFTKYGRMVWYTVLEKYYVFFQVCLGIWTDRCYECYKDLIEMQRSLFSAPIHPTAVEYLYCIIIPRSILLQICPPLTVFCVFCSYTAMFPLFVYSKELNNFLCPLIYTDKGSWWIKSQFLMKWLFTFLTKFSDAFDHCQQLEMKETGGIHISFDRSHAWELYLRAHIIKYTQSRLYGYIRGCIFFVMTMGLYYSNSNNVTYFVWMMFFFQTFISCYANLLPVAFFIGNRISFKDKDVPNFN